MADLPPGVQNEYKLDKLGILPVLGKTLFVFHKSLITAPFRDKKRCSKSWRQHVSCAVARMLVGEVSVMQGQWASAGTDTNFKMVTRVKKMRLNSVPLESGATGHWIGSPEAKYVMLYCHGGGFIQSATYGHVAWLYTLYHEITTRGRDMSIFFLSYTLAPQAFYPQQLCQATAALNYLLGIRDPSTILLGGDSAGGNLVAALLLHIARPRAEVSAVQLLDKGRLRAAVLISPWVSFDTTLDSFRRNKMTDYLSIKAINRASSAYIGPGKQHDAYSQPALALRDWWTDVAKNVVEEVMVWVGCGEILEDGIKKFTTVVADGFRTADDAEIVTRQADGADGDAATATLEDGEQKYAASAQGEAGGIKKLDAGSTHGGSRDLTPCGSRRVTLIEAPMCVHEQQIFDHILRARKKNRRGPSSIRVEAWVWNRLS